MEEAFFENSRVDALAMERLTSSPHVINLYAYCGMTVVTQFAGRELADVANKLNSTERLELASNVAQGLADIHSIGSDGDGADKSDYDSVLPSLAHGDVTPSNIVFTQDGKAIWNDFNVATLLMKDDETGDVCPFQSHFPNPQWRSPEEQVYSENESNSKPPVVTYKADIYGLGNVLYRLAIGSSPWKQPGAKKLTAEEKLTVAQLKRTNGTLPHIPEDAILYNNTRKKDPAIDALLEAMYLAFRYDPDDRPSATLLAEFLKDNLAKIRIEQKREEENNDGPNTTISSSSSAQMQ